MFWLVMVGSAVLRFVAKTLSGGKITTVRGAFSCQWSYSQ